MNYDERLLSIGHNSMIRGLKAQNELCGVQISVRFRKVSHRLCLW